MLPTQKLSRSRTRRRRAHDALGAAHYTYCKQCNSPKLPHAACANCWYVRRGLRLEVKKES